MSFEAPGEPAAKWITLDAETVSFVVEEVLRQETWWIAARSGKLACPRAIWVDHPSKGEDGCSSGVSGAERTIVVRNAPDSDDPPS